MRAASGAEALVTLNELRRRGDAGRAADRRPAHAGHGGHRVPDAGADDLPGRQARPADGVRRHGRRHRRDQRGVAGLLPAQAVGSAGGAALPGASRISWRTWKAGSALDDRRRAASSATASRRSPTTCATSWPATASPAGFLDVERDGEARELLMVANVADDRLPVAMLEDGSVVERPTILELAERLGVTGTPAADHYDLVIVGGGPAGPRRGGLRRVGGPADRARRARGDRRTGRPVQPHRELPRLPDRADGLGPGAPGDRPGAPPGRRAADRPRRGGAARRGRRARRASSAAAPSSARTASSSPPVSPTASSTPPASRS